MSKSSEDLPSFGIYKKELDNLKNELNYDSQTEKNILKKMSYFEYTFEKVNKFIKMLKRIKEDLMLFNYHVIKKASKPEYGPSDILNKFCLIPHKHELIELEYIRDIEKMLVNYYDLDYEHFLEYFYERIRIFGNKFLPNLFTNKNMNLVLSRKIEEIYLIVLSYEHRIEEYKNTLDNRINIRY